MSFIRTLTATVLIAAMALPLAPVAHAQNLREGVVAKVNDQMISTYDLRQRMMLLSLDLGVPLSGDSNIQLLRQKALSDLRDETLQMQEVRRIEREFKVTIMASEEEVDDHIKRLASQNRSGFEEFSQMLSSRGIQMKTLRDQLRAAISWQRYISARFGPKIRVNEGDIDALMSKIAAASSEPSYRINEIFIEAARVGGMTAATQRADQVSTILEQQRPQFSQVAQRFSTSSTAANGGEAGWLALSQMDPKVAEVVKQMQPGQISRPIPVSDGVYIVALTDYRAGDSSVRATIKQAAISAPADADPQVVERGRRALVALKGRVRGCDDLDRAAQNIDGVAVSDLGRIDVSALAPVFRETVEALKPGEASDPVRTEAGLHMLVVCSKVAGGELPDRDLLAERLRAEQLEMTARRNLRDLVSSATVELR